MSLNPEEKCRLVLAAETRFLEPAQDLVRSMALGLGLDPTKADGLARAAANTMAHAIDQAYAPDERGTLTVTIFRTPDRIVVSVEDQGLPMDTSQWPQARPKDHDKARVGEAADEVRVVNLGPKGKRVDIMAHLPRIAPEEDLARAPFPKSAPAARTSIRALGPEDAVALARLVYRTYGYSYFHDYLYYPEKVQAMMNQGRMLTRAAVTAEGEVVSHAALLLETPDSPVAEMGQAIVDPRFRKQGLLTAVTQSLIQEARQKGLAGLFAEAVTLHPFSQKSLLRIGASETGVFLGLYPESVLFKEIPGGDDHQRVTAIQFYLGLNPGPGKPLFAPSRHRNILTRIVSACGLDREILDGSTAEPDWDPATVLEVRILPSFGQGYLKVKKLGRDFAAHVFCWVNDLCQQGMQCLLLDLPLERPAASRILPELEELGFFFGGLVPEMGPEGDILRLQYLHGVPLDLGRVALASEFSRELLGYVSHLSGRYILPVH